MDKKLVISEYGLNKNQVFLIDKYLYNLKNINQNLNLVGPSTIPNFWDRHVNDSLQLSKFIKDKKSSIIDLGTGAGIPGLILSIYGYKNILLVDSKLKKTNFIKSFVTENNIITKIMCSRVEKIKNRKFDYIICRAFAPLYKILNYSLIYTKKNTSLLFLKGRNVKNEIDHAKKHFDFSYELYNSKSQGEGFILKINNFSKI